MIGEDEVPAEFRDVTVEGSLSLGNHLQDLMVLTDRLSGQSKTHFYMDGAGVASDEEITEGAMEIPCRFSTESGLSLGRLPDGSDGVNGVDFATNLEPWRRWR